MLIRSRKILTRARREGYAVGHFNVYNMETTMAVVQAIKKTGMPSIIAITETTIRYAGLSNIATIVKTVLKNGNDVQAVLHLDHGKNLDIIKKCISYGFTSVMYDGSALPYDENVKYTKQVVEIAHKNNVPVEGEIGHVGRVGEITPKEYLTDPNRAGSFVEETGVDSCAISVGTVHGMVEKLKIDYKRLEQINKIVKIPLVIHGGTGLKGDDVKKLLSQGVSKINIDTALRIAFMRGLRQNITETDPRRPLSSAMEEVESVTKQYIDMFNNK